jgi:hypothetical protein
LNDGELVHRSRIGCGFGEEAEEASERARDCSAIR